MARPVDRASSGKDNTGSRPSSLVTRSVSALVLAPPVLAAVYFGFPYFELLAAGAAVIMAWEWGRLCRSGSEDGGGSLCLFAGALYILLPVAGLVWLRTDAETGRETLLWLFLLVWAADTGAYLFGRTIGGAKLAPRISPNKTWAGLAGAVICAAAAGAGMGSFLGLDGLTPIILISALMGAVDQGGDLMESAVKRHFGVKDASNLIPGHGGLLDRADGLLAVGAVMALISLAGEGSILTW